MRLLRKALRVGRSQGWAAVAAMTVRKLLHVLHIRRITGYPFGNLERLSDIDPYEPDTVPGPRVTWRPGPTMRLRWYMPEPGRGSGGHQTLFRLIRLLGDRGHQSEVAVLDGALVGKSREGMRAFVRAHFYADVPVVWDDDELRDVDVALASSWHSAYVVAADFGCALRAYVVQDWEPDFYPRGTEQFMAENSYLLGHLHLTAGPWLAGRLRRLGLPAHAFHLGADQTAYYPTRTARARAREGALGSCHVVFYARTTTPRRCFGLGCEALRLLDRRLGPGRLTVSMVGSDTTRFPTPYQARWLGIVAPADLRQLYGAADVVLVLSGTNPSLVPLEAALCEAPVVDLMVPSAEGTLVDGVTGRLALPSPANLAATMAELIEHPGEAAALGRRARRHALQYTWETAAAEVEQHLLDALTRTRPGGSAAEEQWPSGLCSCHEPQERPS